MVDDGGTNSVPNELEPVWKCLPKPLLELLWQSGWKSAGQLEAAFDSEQEAVQLVQQLDGNCEVPKTNLTWGRALLEWQTQAVWNNV